MNLRDGDNIKVGDVTFVFHDPETTTHDNPIPNLEVDTTAGVVRVNRKVVSLSPKEYLLVAYLYERRGQVCSKDDIGHTVWPDTRLEEYLITRLKTWSAVCERVLNLNQPARNCFSPCAGWDTN